MLPPTPDLSEIRAFYPRLFGTEHDFYHELRTLCAEQIKMSRPKETPATFIELAVVQTVCHSRLTGRPLDIPEANAARVLQELARHKSYLGYLLSTLLLVEIMAIDVVAKISRIMELREYLSQLAVALDTPLAEQKLAEQVFDTLRTLPE